MCHVACTPHAPPPCLAHVPRVACTPHATSRFYFKTKGLVLRGLRCFYPCSKTLPSTRQNKKSLSFFDVRRAADDSRSISDGVPRLASPGVPRLASPAPCPAHVPHVARTPHAPPSARRTCHTWHARRTLRPLPGARATRGMYAARSAPARRMCHTWHHVQHVASHRRRRPLAWIMCHTWHHAARPAPGPANPNQGLPGARCVPHHAWSQKYRHSMRHVWSKCHMWHDLRVPGVADLPPPTR